MGKGNDWAGGGGKEGGIIESPHTGEKMRTCQSESVRLVVRDTTEGWPAEPPGWEGGVLKRGEEFLVRSKIGCDYVTVIRKPQQQRQQQQQQQGWLFSPFILFSRSVPIPESIHRASSRTNRTNAENESTA